MGYPQQSSVAFCRERYISFQEMLRLVFGVTCGSFSSSTVSYIWDENWVVAECRKVPEKVSAVGLKSLREEEMLAEVGRIERFAYAGSGLIPS